MYNSTGIQNVGLGQSTLQNNQTGSSNTAIGSGALLGVTGQSVSSNTAVGLYSLYNNTNDSNSAVGCYSLYDNSSGTINTALGYYAGQYNNTGSYNTFLGAYTDVSNNGTTEISEYSYSTAIGYNAQIDSSNQIMLGGLNNNIYPLVYAPGGITGSIATFESLTLHGELTGKDATFSGTVTASNIPTTSDYRIKENVIKLGDNFNVDNLVPVTYKNIITNKQDVGLIAHEVQEIFPQLVNGEKDGKDYQSVNYIGLIPILIKEIQDLKKELNILKNKIDKDN